MADLVPAPFNELTRAAELLLRVGEHYAEKKIEVASLQTALREEETRSRDALKTAEDTCYKLMLEVALLENKLVDKAAATRELGIENDSLRTGLREAKKAELEANEDVRKLRVQASDLRKKFRYAVKRHAAEIAELKDAIKDQKNISSGLEHKVAELTKDNLQRSCFGTSPNPVKTEDAEPGVTVPAGLKRKRELDPHGPFVRATTDSTSWGFGARRWSQINRDQLQWPRPSRLSNATSESGRARREFHGRVVSTPAEEELSRGDCSSISLALGNREEAFS